MFIKEKVNDGHWVIRWQAEGHLHEIETAYPLPKKEVSAAQILAREDLSSIRSPHEPLLVWITKTGEELEVHPLL